MAADSGTPKKGSVVIRVRMRAETFEAAHRAARFVDDGIPVSTFISRLTEAGSAKVLVAQSLKASQRDTSRRTA